MTPLATVLYEDSMRPNANGEYPLHDLVMQLVEDEINGQTRLLRPLVDKNPRKGINNVLNDVKRTALIAGAGKLYLLVDRDKIARHLGLQANAPDADVVDALKERSDAKDKLHPFFLLPNVEGLLRSIQACDRDLLPRNVKAALRKKLNDRDIVFNETGKTARKELRDCVCKEQPGLSALAKTIANTVSSSGARIA